MEPSHASATARNEVAPALRDLLHEIRESRFASGLACVRCGATRVRRWGHFAGRQRYRCQVCRRTFSDLTGTPAAYLKRLLLLPAYRECLQATLSVRASARAIGLHPTTTFRWRHRLLQGMMPFDVPRLGGLVEIDEGWVLCANTAPRETIGSRRAARPRRSHADPTQRRSCVAVLRDRTGRSTLEAVGFVRPNLAIWAELLTEFVDPPAVVITRRRRLSPQVQAARVCGLGVWHERQGPLARVEPSLQVPAPVRAEVPLRSVGHARDLLRALRRWLRRFRGISTRYLSNYLYWHGLLDPQRRTEIRLTRMLCWPHAAKQTAASS